jgi:hypothetical protein
MSYLIYDTAGQEVGSEDYYSTALAIAKTVNRARIVYQGVRGQSVLVYPLPSSEEAGHADETAYR